MDAAADDGVESHHPLAPDSKPAPDETEHPLRPSHRLRRRVTLAAVIAVLLAAALVLPPLVNISRYQRQVTELMTRSMGRPVRMSGVELRLLPSPGFVLRDLAVSEDPAFGAEPILSARTVVASVRLFSLWRGHLEISEVSVDEASLNLVRSAEGRWNLETLLMGAQPVAGGTNAEARGAKPSAHFPYLSATNSRVNFKNGVEKTPFSLANTDLSFWQENPGQWRLRLLGQPVRTDLPMSAADTGEVRMEASLQSAAQLREMPVKLQMEWRAAQLGQLSRLILGSDAGWRGDMTADIEMHGTLESAETKARLRATGVRREEFVPEISLDFDTNCAFRYQHSEEAFHDIGCDTAIGEGRLHLKAELPGSTPGEQPEGMLEVHQVPLQAALDLLRTVRSDFAPGVLARGTANGNLHYKAAAAAATSAQVHLTMPKASRRGASKVPPPASDLQGSLSITGAELSGGSLSAPLKVPEFTLTPALIRQVALALPPGNLDVENSREKATPTQVSIENRTKLVALFTVPLDAMAAKSETPAEPNPQGNPSFPATQMASVQLLLDQHGYQAQITGLATIARLRELASGFGWHASAAENGFQGGTADFSLASEGAWIADANGDLSLGEGEIAAKLDQGGIVAAPPTQLTLHHTEWHPKYLAHPVRFALATVQRSGSVLRFAGDFTFGAAGSAGQTGTAPAADPVSTSPNEAAKDPARDVVHGSVTVSDDTNCVNSGNGTTDRAQAGVAANADLKADPCTPQVEIRFGALDAATIQAALEPAPEKKSVFSPITDRMRSADQVKLPTVTATVQADSLILGPVTLQKPVIHLRSFASEIKIADWQAQLLGGSAKGTAHIGWDEGKPRYEILADFAQLNGNSAGALLDSRWTGGTVDGGAKVTLSGLIPKDLMASAIGDLHFDWRKGSVFAASGVAPGELHFDRWMGDATITSGAIKTGKNTVVAGRQRYSVEASIPLGGPAKLSLKPSENPDPDQDGKSGRKPDSKDAAGKTAAEMTHP
jgi:hypothetical protein